MEYSILHFGAALIRRTGLLCLAESIEAQRGNLLRILEYHRIGEPGANHGLLDPSLLSATPDQFEQQMRFLSENYRLLSIHELLQAIEIKKPLPPKSVLVTFDDGYHDFLETAWPILARYQVPTLMFLATGFLFPENQLFWWDRLYQGVCKTTRVRLSLPAIGTFLLENKSQRWDTFVKLKKIISCVDFHLGMLWVDQILEELEVVPETKGFLMNWSDIRWLSERGCNPVAHTRHHPILSRISIEEAQQEIHDSCLDIYQETGFRLPVLAYPSGHVQDCRHDLSPILREEGLKIVMSSIPGFNDLKGCDLMRLKRIGPSPRVNMIDYRLILTGWFDLLGTVQARFSHSN
jgi:peptidoglycan/xylan/chitin deacetylase (PgdA/CDA1 family)